MFTGTFQFPIYRVFDNERIKALAYNFGQKGSYDLGHVAIVSYISDILIFRISNNQQNIFRQNLGKWTKCPISNISEKNKGIFH